MTARPTTVERAYQLARAGYRKIDHIKRRLKAEGYPDVEGQLYGAKLRRQLQEIGSGANDGVPDSPPIRLQKDDGA